ncbi:MAG: ABC transporter ATP-binding protein [Candidatus Poribacteria bacterium]|nr:ABC transporter ATP-binding protein [Candidatus Poribacteria bacterium]
MQNRKFEKVSFGEYWSLLRQYLSPMKFRLLLLAIFMALGNFLPLVTPQILRFFIDTATDNLEASRDVLRRFLLPLSEWIGSDPLIIAAFFFIAVSIAGQLVRFINSYLSQDIGWRATNQMRGDLAQHCLTLDMTFHHQKTPGEMVERVDGDTTTLATFFSALILDVAGGLIRLGLILILVAREDWRIGIAMTAFTAVAMLVFNLTRSIAVPIYAAEREGYAKMFGFIEERIGGIEDIRTNGGVPYTMNRFFKVVQEVFKLNLRSDIIGECLRSLTGGLFALGYALAMGVSIWLYQNGVFTLGAIVLVFDYMRQLQLPLYTISRQINELQRATAGMKRIEQLYQTQSSLKDGSKSPLPLSAENIQPIAIPDVAFDQVTFGYVEEEMVLKNLSFELGKGKVLGLLGRTGSGKTTITRLLFRLYDINKGEIRIAGTSIQELKQADLRHYIGLVTQDVQLFNATVRQNLSLFDDQISDQKIVSVIEELGLTDWYQSLPEGLDSLLAAGGSGLSAGEAQLLAFTRIFLKDPGIIILDEPSSRLDPATEARIDFAVQKLLQGRTGIIIAHRLGTLQRVDEVMILEGGQIREYGPRQTLANDPKSRFAELLKTGLEGESNLSRREMLA